jgi:16S rRNA (cytidine1402-2'-O)-methyltransferase
MTENDSSRSPTAPSSAAPTPEAASPALVLVSTPIGNLQDFSIRAREALEQADAILCEDTRTSGILLHHYGIRTRLIALHDHNEDMVTPRLLAEMRGGACYALISDAGTPLVSDPGYRLTRAAIDAGLTISGIPGPNAAVLALTLSGLPPQPFLFMGFLPAKSGPRRAVLEVLRHAEAAGLAATTIFYEAPHRIAETLADAASALGDRPAAVCRELSKRFEEIRRGSLAELAVHYAEQAARGEITLVIGPAADAVITSESLDDSLSRALETMSLRDAVNAVTAATGVARKQVYARALSLNPSKTNS